MRLQRPYDAVIAGGGHNGLTAAAYLARAGRRVLLLERAPALGGLAVSQRPFPGVDARVSRYSYLVSLLPTAIRRDLRLPVELRRRRISSYTPLGAAGLLVDTADPARTAASFTAVTGDGRDHAAWQALLDLTARAATRLAPTLLQPLRTRRDLRAHLADDDAWRALFDTPIGDTVTARIRDDTVRGIVLTDALIGTFTDPRDPARLANRCFLYHVIGDGTGEWKVPAGGMGAVTAALAAAARSAGADLRTGSEVTAITTGPASAEVTFRDTRGEHTVTARHVLAALPPAVLGGLLGTPAPAPEGSQLKLNMVLARLPRLRDPAVPPADAFAGTFHINEGLTALTTAHAQAAAGTIPALPPAETYCHTLTDPGILGPALRASGAHTLTLFGLHMPARLFTGPAARDRAIAATLASADSVLAEPLTGCLLTDAHGRPCLEARTPADLETEAHLPGGHIFHRDLTWPYAEDPADAGRWGVETADPRILLCGAGARRGGGVSGIPGHNAARALLG